MAAISFHSMKLNVMSFFQKVSSCNCTRECVTEVYENLQETILDTTDIEPNKLRLRVYFQVFHHFKFQQLFIIRIKLFFLKLGQYLHRI